MQEPAASPEDGGRYRFGVFAFDASALELRKNGRPLRIRPQALTLLRLLVARAGELVSRDDIQKALWGRETFVDFEQGVNHCIKELRAALGDAAESPRYIQTLPRRGYRFIGPVERMTASEALPPVSTVPLPGPAEPPAGNEVSGSPAASAPARAPRRSGRVWLKAAGLVTVLAGALILPYAARSGGGRTAQVSSLSVLPFASPEADPALGIGLANAISARLGGQQLVPIRTPVTGRERSQAEPSEPEAGGRMRGPALVLDGEIRTSGTEVTVLARLKDAASGEATWSERFRVRANELFSVEDVIAERVVAALDLRLAAAEQDRLRRRYTSNTAAYEAYLRGRAALVRYTPEGTLQAVEAFEGALQRDPEYALARAGLAMACADMYLRFAAAGDVERWGARTEAEARAALDLDGDLAEAHLARAAVARKREFDWNATMEASRRALVLNPNLDQAHFFMAAAYYHLGYMEEALLEMKKGRTLRGADVIEPVRIEALVALFSGNFVTARVHLEEVSRLSSQTIGDTYLALADYYSGRVERGRTLLTSLATHTSASTAARSGAALAGVLADQGETVAARMQVDRVLARDYRDHHVAYSLGAAYAQLGDVDAAVRWLRTAADTGFPCLPWFERDPLLEPVRRRAEFAELLAYARSRRESSLSRVD